jgi:hypothetical protein
MPDVSCKSIGMQHDWKNWTRSRKEPHRVMRSCRRCGCREYRTDTLRASKGEGENHG